MACRPCWWRTYFGKDGAGSVCGATCCIRSVIIRQDPMRDHRYVPWFNAPPGNLQRLNLFCLLSMCNGVAGLDAVRRYTHDERYVALPGYKTMSSHYHNEYISKVVLAGKPVVSMPSFAAVFERAGVNIVHLAEFHGVGHPKGPDSLRLRELDALFGQCRRLSGRDFLLLPGEEQNEFFGGHWLAFFPKPVYWIMSKKGGDIFESNDPVYGKVYHIGDMADMLRLLKKEKVLAWTAHPRTKGSTGYPDKYKDEGFFRSDRFLGGAWKAMPADLSQQRLGERVLDLMDDMNNWGLGKRVLAEADLFSIEPENEMYAHMNVNYLPMRKLPVFENGWKPILDTLQRGRFFSTTGEVLIPSFTVNGAGPGDTATLGVDGKARVVFSVQWTFPLRSAELISGDGVHVYRMRPIDPIAQEPLRYFSRVTISLIPFMIFSEGVLTRSSSVTMKKFDRGHSEMVPCKLLCGVGETFEVVVQEDGPIAEGLAEVKNAFSTLAARSLTISAALSSGTS